eukprot:gene3418-4656_t
MFNPLAFDWTNHAALIGNGLLLLAALVWAANIVYVRGHRWISTPFQLVFWQALLATFILTTVALVHDGVPKNIVWTRNLVGAFLFAGIAGTALAHWAMVMINRSLPATVTSLGLLATPVMGVVLSALFLGETVSLSLIIAMAMILGGIAMGTVSRRTAGAVPRLGSSPAAAAMSTGVPGFGQTTAISPAASLPLLPVVWTKTMPVFSVATSGAWPASTPKPPSEPGASTWSTRPENSSRSGETREKCSFSAIGFLRFHRQLFGLGDRVLDRTDVEEGPVSVHNDGSVTVYDVRGGFADVTPDGLTILAEHAAEAANGLGKASNLKFDA